MTDKMTANRSAFDAYNILYYPVFDDVPKDGFAPSEEDFALAMTVQANLANTPYVLSDRAVATLAGIYARIRESREDVVVDPAADIRSFCPDTAMGRPMYPDFPTQVIDMDEDEYRANQLTHYMSTYGVEFFASLFGLDVSVKEGWLPDVENTEKSPSDDKNIEDHVVDIAASPDAMASVVTKDLSRPSRMSAPAVELACVLFSDNVFPDVPKITFHENMMEIVRAAAEHSSVELASVCSQLAQHPGDVLKAVLWCSEKREKNHIPTKAKKGFCRALEKFNADDIAHNIADLSRKGEKAVNMLSVARFGGDELNKAIASVLTGEVRSYNSVLESKWGGYKSGADPDGSELLEWYGKRPGILLRSLARLLREGVPEDVVAAEAMKHVDDYSLATLVQLETVASATELHVERDWAGRASNAEDTARREANMDANEKIARIAARLLFDRFGKMDTPVFGKKVFIDPCGFSLTGSIVLPNEVGNTSGAYPPAGMAYDLPADKTLRFFTFWNEPGDRVDVDLHFKYVDTDGRLGAIGWYCDYNNAGMTTSGDVTHSTNAAEYLDVDMEEAKRSGVDVIFHRAHIYCGAAAWKDIETCFSGALVVGDTSPDVAIYDSKNVLFHDDMTGEGREMDYAMVDVPNHFVRILRGASIPFVRNAFTLDSYIGLLLDAQKAEVVDEIADADVVLSVGRAASDEIDGKKAVSLVDEGFFVE